MIDVTEILMHWYAVAVSTRYGPTMTGQIPAAVATPRLLEVAMGRSRTTHAGSGVTEKQEQFGRLIARGMSNSEACRVVSTTREN